MKTCFHGITCNGYARYVMILSRVIIVGEKQIFCKITKDLITESVLVALTTNSKC